jgi:multiple sugar transport system substrate-binding protein
MVATAAAYTANHPNVRISWQSRSLQDFADYPIEKLAERFDFVLVDHPFMGVAAHSGCLLPADRYLSREFLADQAANSVGASHESYVYGGHQWALATDAAAQVASYRPELLQELGVSVPVTWDEVLALAEARRGNARACVAVPLIPVDTLMTFLSLCANAGEPAFQEGSDLAVNRSIGREALTTMLRMMRTGHPEAATWNPIRAYERMSTTDEIAYIPLAFGYSTYAQNDFRPQLIRFTDIPRASDGVPRGGILGGVGLAVAATTRHPEVAFDYARFVASPAVQRGLYAENGGQPGHRAAWVDETVNAASHGFYRDTLATLDNGYLRPRYLGFMELQDRAGHLLHAFLVDPQDPDTVLDALDDLYRTSRAD